MSQYQRNKRAETETTDNIQEAWILRALFHKVKKIHWSNPDSVYAFVVSEELDSYLRETRNKTLKGLRSKMKEGPTASDVKKFRDAINKLVKGDYDGVEGDDSEEGSAASKKESYRFRAKSSQEEGVQPER